MGQFFTTIYCLFDDLFGLELASYLAGEATERQQSNMFMSIGLAMIGISPFFPQLYNTSDEIRHMAMQFIMISGILMPLNAYCHATYFIIRAGGRTGITMIFDSCFMLGITVPVAFILSRFSNISVVGLMGVVLSLDVLKCIVGGIMVHKGIWARNIVN